MDPLNVIAQTGSAAFATDERGRIIIWNRAAEELLGHPASQTLGRPCHEILCGRDVFGNRFCDGQCSLTRMVEHHEPVRHFELDVRNEQGQTVSVSFSIVVIPGPRPRQYTMIHFMERLDLRQEVGRLVRRVLAERPAPAVPDVPLAALGSTPPGTLTARELQILRMLANGTSTKSIADSLYISMTTTRNHIQSILRKLDVHSKLEAVSLALRMHML